MTEFSIRREGPALLGYYESFARLGKLADKAAKKHPVAHARKAAAKHPVAKKK